MHGNILSERSIALHRELRAIPDGEEPVRYSPQVADFRRSVLGRVGRWVDNYAGTFMAISGVSWVGSIVLASWDSLQFTHVVGGDPDSWAYLTEVFPEAGAVLGISVAIGVAAGCYVRGSRGIRIDEALFQSIHADLSSRGYEVLQSSRSNFSFITPQGVFLLANDDQGEPAMLLNGAKFRQSYESISAHQPEMLTGMDGAPRPALNAATIH